MHSTASAFNKVSRLGPRPPRLAGRSAVQSGARPSSQPQGPEDVAGQAVEPIIDALSVAGHIANRSSFEMTLRATFANQGQGSPAGVIEIRSERLFMRCEEIVHASGTRLQNAMRDLPDFQPQVQLGITQQKRKAEREQQARLKASSRSPTPAPVSSKKVLKIKEMYNKAGSEFVLEKVEGDMAELLGDITQMVFGLDAASQTRKEAMARGGKGRTYFVDVESVAGTGTAIMVSLRSGNCTLAILGAVTDKFGQLHMGMCKAAVDAKSCKCAPLRPILREAAFPLPTGDCHDSQLTLKFLDKRGREHGPGLVLVTRFSRVVVDLKKNPEARGDMIRIRINERAVGNLLESETDKSGGSVVEVQDVNSAGGHIQGGSRFFPHPLSLGSDPKHNLLRYDETDELASSARGPGGGLEYGTRNGSKARVSPVGPAPSVAPHTGSKTGALQATSSNHTQKHPSAPKLAFGAKPGRGAENGSEGSREMTGLQRRPRMSLAEQQIAIREALDDEDATAHETKAKSFAQRDADQESKDIINGQARKGERGGKSSGRSLRNGEECGPRDSAVSSAELKVSKRSHSHTEPVRITSGTGSTKAGPKV